MGRLVAVQGALPEHRYAQDEITQAFLEACVDDEPGRVALVRRLHASSQVEFRHLAYPLEQYVKFDTFATANDAFIEAAVDLGAQALVAALGQVGFSPTDLDVIVSTTVTGIAVPSLEARIAERLGCRSDVRRLPLFGVGCAGGAAGVALLDDQLRAHPEQVGALVSVELCSLTTQRGHDAVPHLVASALFGDGAAAVVAVGTEHPSYATLRGPTVVASASRLYPDSERAMGWDVGEWGLRIVLDADVPDLVERHLGPDVRAFLAEHDLTTNDIDPWVCHPGGPKVLQAAAASLALDDEAFVRTWRSLRAIGNLSSSSVLHVLGDTLRDQPPEGDGHALLMAMGPGFASELVLLDW
jgi:alkylresorcinol/alkylpyrone synthase